MLSSEKNRLLTQVGPGTPMGELLRRYWMPIGGASELDKNPIKPMRLMGEDLVLYKARRAVRAARPPLPAPARGSHLRLRRGAGIRCNYHGWLMNEAGACLEQPYDDIVNPHARAKERCGTKAYPVRECAGLLWAYMGPQPAPELPVWEPFTWENGFREIVLSDVPCNWFQCQENSCDPVHFEWMHDNWSLGSPARPVPMPASTSSSSSRSSSTASSTSACARTRRDNPYWTVGRVALWPNGFYLGNHFEWRVPVDDENTLSVAWFFMRVPKGASPMCRRRSRPG